jgi:hypothetical protein
VSLRIENARIRTGDPAQPWAKTVVFRDGRVAAIDRPEAAAEVVDAGGRTVLPGFIDAHLHLLEGGLSLRGLDLSGVASRGEFERAVAQAHADLAPGRWLVGRGWSDGNWPGHGEPDRSWLAAAGERPAACWRMDLHAVLVNDAVLARIDSSHDPPGGRIVRGAGGAPTGLLLERAAWDLVSPIVPAPSAAERSAALGAAQEHLLRHGVTGAATMENAGDLAGVLEPLRGRLRLRLRVILLERGGTPDLAFARGFRGDDRLAVIGCKSFADGTLGSRTARMFQDYCDDPGNRGLLLEHAAAGTLRAWANAVAGAGLSPVVHAIGDEAIALALDAIVDVDDAARPRIEHVQHVSDADIDCFAGVIASMQPLHKAHDCRDVERRLGPARLAGTFAFRDLLDAGAILAFGSDWPVVSCDPLAGIRAAVTGLTLDGRVAGPEQNLTLDEALAAYTTGAAYACRMDRAGVLRPGAAGDAVVLDRDPCGCDWADDPPRVLMTIAGGQVAYDGR